MAVSEPRPTVVADDISVTYRVFATGKREQDGRSLLRRRPAVRRSRAVHALRNISFVAHEGDAIGVVGTNDSGKSTLMRAFAGLTVPTSGAIYAGGDPALLGVNAPLVNDLSGERSVILGGLALGMTPEEVRRRDDEIVEFAGLGDFMEPPMCTYFPEMSARLRLAEAASATHKVLLIDEALAVGEGEFRRRSERRIQELQEAAGTVVLISHSMRSIQKTCNRTIWVEKGVLRMDGPTDAVVEAYTKHVAP